MTRTFSDGHPKVLPGCNFLSQYYFYNIFLQKSCRFSLQTLTKFEAAKTGSGVGLLRLTAVWLRPSSDAVLHMSRIECKWGRTKDFAHLHSIRLMWSTASELFLRPRPFYAEKFENAVLFVRLGLTSTLIRQKNKALFLWLGLPSTLIRHENAAFRKQSQIGGIWKRRFLS